MTNRKISSFELAYLPIKDSSFTESFVSLKTHGVFYGTDTNNQREGYLVSVQKALEERIKDPIMTWCKDPKTCFFKPYQDTREGFDGLTSGVVNPLLAVLCGLGFFGAWATHPAAIIALFCTPALFELVAGVVGLIKSAWYQLKYLYTHAEEEQNEAATYFLDAMTRLALVLPLAIVSLISAPFEFIRFITRSLSSIVTYLADTSDSIPESEPLSSRTDSTCSDIQI